MRPGTKQPLMLELFSGSAQMAKAFKARGWRTITFDKDQAADHQMDLLTLTRKMLLELTGGEIPAFIWASPPCTAFSVASVSDHWQKTRNGNVPKTRTAFLGLALLRKTLEIISWFPGVKFGIENPRGMMRKQPELQDLNRYTVTYCQYGDHRMKPTDIWTNSQRWIPRPACRNGDRCHDAQPRGYKAKQDLGAHKGMGTQGLSNAYERGIIPQALCEEIVKSISDEC